MKKHLFFAATAALVLASCSSDSVDFTQADVLQAQDDNSVQFSTYMGKTGTTRAEVSKSYSQGTIGNADDAVQGITDLKEARFGVFAYQTTSTDYVPATPTVLVPNFMYNQEVWFDDANSSGKNAWVYSPVKYWPNGIDAQNAANAPSNTAGEVLSGGKLSFFAFAPYTAATSTSYAYSGVTDTKPAAIGTTTTNDDKVKTTVNTKGVTAITANDWNGNVWVKYVLGSYANSASETNFVDLLWGTRGSANYDKTGSSSSDGATVGKDYNINLTKQIVGEKVKFLFKHALTKVGGATAKTTGETTTGDPLRGGFKVVVDVDGNNGDNQGSYFPAGFDQTQTLVTIKEVKIQDGFTAGQDATVTTVENTTKSNLNTYGWFNIETGKWCNEANTYGKVGDDGALYEVVANDDETLTNTTYRLNEKILEIGAKKNGAGGDGKEIASSGTAWTSGTMPSGVGTTAVDLFANENVPALMLIPGGSADLYVTVDYFVRTADKSLNAGFTNVEQKITNKVSLGNLDPNKYYTIIMHLGLTSVKFEAVVADWAANSNESYDEETGEDKSTGDLNGAKVWLPSNVVSYAVTQDALATATSAAIDISSYGIGNYVSSSIDTDVDVDNVTGSGTGVTVNFDATNTTTTDKVNVVTIVGELGKVTITLTHKAGALAVSGTGSNTKVTGFSVTDAATNPLTITKAMLSIKDELSNNVEFTTDDDSHVGTITFGTALTAGKTYTITVKYGDATGTKVVSYE